jgi:putative PIN family toxin of toxin-antitoxin system
MKCVIDTNGLLRSVPRRSEFRWLYDAWKSKKFIWVVSNEIITEYAEVIEREYSLQAADIVIETLLTSNNHQRTEAFFKWQLVESDPDDNKFVDCAIASNADYLVSDDKDILQLNRIPSLFPPIPIVDFDTFREVLGV